MIAEVCKTTLHIVLLDPLVDDALDQARDRQVDKQHRGQQDQRDDRQLPVRFYEMVRVYGYRSYDKIPLSLQGPLN